MNTLHARSAAKLGAAFALVAASLQPAFADASHDRYRCVVLGDTSACAPREDLAATPSQEFSGYPYATYLAREGRVAEARRIVAYGMETPVRWVSLVPERPLTDVERYQRYLGQDVR
jgi:hypothetical protein